MLLTQPEPDRRHHRPEVAFQEWETPAELFARIAALFGGFDVDAAASEHNAKCARFWTAKDNGLVQDWSGLAVFVNPPFVEAGRWAQKAFEETRGDHCPLAVVLCPPKTDAKWWALYPPEWIIWVTGRISFLRDGVPRQGNDSPSCLLCYSEQIYVVGEVAVLMAVPVGPGIVRNYRLPRCIPARVRNKGRKLI